jgi:hypothetical protein
MQQFVFEHMIVNVDYIYAQKRRYLVFFHVSHNVNLFNEQFQCDFAIFVLRSFIWKIESMSWVFVKLLMRRVMIDFKILFNVFNRVMNLYVLTFE